MTSEGNHYNQKILHTADGGYLIAATQYCYTPGQVVIEGCTNAILLQRLNASEEVVWENEFYYPGGNSGGTNLFEHDDGTFTLIAGENGNNVCNGLIAGFGIFSHLLIKNLDAQGNVTASTIFPDECEQEFRDAIQLDDDRFAVLSYYSEFGSTAPLKEGRLSIISKTGQILNQVSLTNVAFYEGQLFLADDGTIQLIYNFDQGAFKLLSFDDNLSPIGSFTNTALEAVYQLSGYKKNRITLLDNGEWIFLVDFPHEDIDNTYFFRLDTNFELAAQAVYTLESPSNIVQSPDAPNTYFLAAAHQYTDESLDTEIFEMDQEGNLNGGWIIEAEGDERPELLVPHATEAFLLTGAVNCCNEPESVGPGHSFFTVGYSVVNTNELSLWEHQIQLSPTLAREAVQLEILDASLLTKSLEITIYDAAGRLVHTQDVVQSKTSISVSDWFSGIYFYSLKWNGELIKNGKFVKA